jgi:long-chain fatty acid transport protein
MTKGNLRRASLAGAVALLGTWSGNANASGFQLAEQNGSGLGNAYSGQAAAAEDASTIFFNPAGLTHVPGIQFVGALNLVRPVSNFRDGGSTPATLQTLGGDGGDGGVWAPVPSFYASWEFLPGRLWAGLGVSVPFGLSIEWDPDWMGRFHGINSEVETINFNPTVAWKINQWISVGAGANLQRLSAELTNSVNYSAIAFGVGGAPALAALAATCPGADGTGAGCEGVGKVSASDWAWGWNVGAMIDFPTRTRLGISYRSVTKHALEGDATFGNRPALLAAGLPDGPIRANVNLPDTASVAVWQQVLPPLQLLADFTWTGWASLQDLSIFRISPPTGVRAELTSTPLKFKDSWRVGLGGNYRLTDEWKLRAGVAFDKTPVRNDRRTPRLPDQDRWWAAAGAQWAFSSRGAIDVGVAHLFIKDASSNLPNVDPAPPAGFSATPRGNLVGTYTGNVWILSAQARYSFL